MILKEGEFYQRVNGNIFRVISIIKWNYIPRGYKIRNVRHNKNGNPYTYQSIIKHGYISPKKYRRIGTEEILNILANNVSKE